jgi:integrase
MDTVQRRSGPHNLHKVSVRSDLEPRREPYWAAPLRKGHHIGLRKISEAEASWIARIRPQGGIQEYKALGLVRPDFGYDQAKLKAEEWFKQKDAGINTKDVVTVADACRAYVKDLRGAKREDTAHDAEKRFERTVFDNTLGSRPLDKLRTQNIKTWRDGLGLKPGTSNRTLTALKAALNLAVAHRQVAPSAAIEWEQVKPLKGGKRRDLYLDLKQRRALMKVAKGASRDLMEGVTHTGARAGELVKAKRRQFDARTESMTFIGKTGTRTVPLSPAAAKLFTRLAKGKEPEDHLFTRDDGQPWAHSDWDEGVREAAKAAKLPADPHTGTCLYTLRHSWITTAITKGMTTLDVARLAGTSVVMIEKHYGHLVASAARERLAKVKML